MARKSDAYDRVTVDGHMLNKRTYAAFLTAQARPDGDNDWTVFQGSYNPGGVGVSGGTHDGGGAIDISPFNADQRVHALRAVGFAAWRRPTIPGTWNEHIHCVLVGDHEMSPAAKAQIVDYLAQPPRDGLASHSADPTWHPNPPVVFDYPAYVREQARLKARAQRANLAFRNAIASLVRARKNTDDKARREQIQRFIESLRSKH